MSKSLSEMTADEIYRLFPVSFAEHNDQWKKWYEEEKNNIESFIPEKYQLKINHMGSTAIKEIKAKPIIDIIIEVPLWCTLEEIGNIFISNGYAFVTKEGKKLYLNKGYTENGFAERVFHIHLRFYGDNGELYFRDYMNENKAVRKEYENLKLTLGEKYKYNRDKYTAEKASYVLSVTKKAREIYKDRY